MSNENLISGNLVDAESPGEVKPSQGQPVSVTIQLPRKRPVLTFILIALTVSVFILQYLSETMSGIDWPLLLGSKVNELISRGQVWRLITPVLLHGSIAHLLFNMYALYAIGPELERTYGRAKFLGLYLLSGFTGITASFIFSSQVSIGSSTSIFGLVAAEGIFIYQNRRLFGKRARSMLTNIGFIVLINLVLGLSPGIDNWGHIGGLMGGFAFAWFAGPKYSLSGQFPVFTLVDQHPKSRDIWVFIGIAVISSILVLFKVYFL